MIQQYLKNKIAGQRINALEAVEILGDEKLVEKAAANWQVNGEYLKTIELALLLDYCQTTTFSKEEFDAFKLGLSAMNIFLESCLLQVQNRANSSQ